MQGKRGVRWAANRLSPGGAAQPPGQLHRSHVGNADAKYKEQAGAHQPLGRWAWQPAQTVGEMQNKQPHGRTRAPFPQLALFWETCRSPSARSSIFWPFGSRTWWRTGSSRVTSRSPQKPSRPTASTGWQRKDRMNFSSITIWVAVPSWASMQIALPSSGFGAPREAAEEGAAASLPLSGAEGGACCPICKRGDTGRV